MNDSSKNSIHFHKAKFKQEKANRNPVIQVRFILCIFNIYYSIHVTVMGTKKEKTFKK